MPKGEPPSIVSEFFLALEFGWKPNEVRSMPYRDVDMFTTLLGVVYNLRKHGKDIPSQNMMKALGVG